MGAGAAVVVSLLLAASVTQARVVAPAQVALVPPGRLAGYHACRALGWVEVQAPTPEEQRRVGRFLVPDFNKELSDMRARLRRLAAAKGANAVWLTESGTSTWSAPYLGDMGGMAAGCH